MITRVGVVVPAADEEQRIAACLTAVREAVARLRAERPALAVTTVVVLDSCRDGTAGIVARFAEVTALRSSARRVGVARRTGSVRLEPDERTWLAHTDADSQVPPDWLTHMVGVADRGAELVFGTVLPDADAETLRSWQRLHVANDGHPHVHGANLGVRADVLDRLGGWRPLATGEDVDLARRAHAGGFRIHRCGAVPVRTSARRHGRAPHGFSSYLRTLGEPAPA